MYDASSVFLLTISLHFLFHSQSDILRIKICHSKVIRKVFFKFGFLWRDWRDGAVRVRRTYFTKETKTWLLATRHAINPYQFRKDLWLPQFDPECANDFQAVEFVSRPTSRNRILPQQIVSVVVIVHCSVLPFWERKFRTILTLFDGPKGLNLRQRVVRVLCTNFSHQKINKMCPYAGWMNESE